MVGKAEQKAELIKVIKELCLVSLSIAKLKAMSIEQLEEFKQDLINNGGIKSEN